ncbi:MULTISPECIES: hypothetical protein [unclassified Herbaspirillum]|uniref:hypothetical protein n=1 Tax=unclassified Herbaspirillum TaxID=2624150 RepID=UPI00383B72A4
MHQPPFRSLAKLFSCSLIVFFCSGDGVSNAQQISERIDGHGRCEYVETDDGICGWLSPLERKEKYEFLMTSAYERLQVLLQEMQSADSEVMASYYDRVISDLNFAQKTWVTYNSSECGLAGTLALDARQAAFDCEVEGLRIRFLKINQSFACLKEKSVQERITEMPGCLSKFLPLIYSEGRGF